MNYFNRIWKHFASVFFKGVEWVCRAALGVQIIVCIIIFFGRYLFKTTPVWGESLALMCLVWMCILSSSLAIVNDGHLRVTAFDHLLSKRALFILELISSIIIFCFAMFMIKAGWYLARSAVNNNMAGLGISKAWMNGSIPVAGVVYVIALIEQWRRRWEECQQK